MFVNKPPRAPRESPVDDELYFDRPSSFGLVIESNKLPELDSVLGVSLAFGSSLLSKSLYGFSSLSSFFFGGVSTFGSSFLTSFLVSSFFSSFLGNSFFGSSFFSTLGGSGLVSFFGLLSCLLLL